MEFKELINKARQEKERGKLKEAVYLYNKASNIFCEAGANYARDISGEPGNLDKFREYLKRNTDACTTSNETGLVFAELSRYDTAKMFFEQAIELTPDGVNYPDPHINLKNLAK